MGSKAGLDVCGKSHPHRDSIPGPSGQYRVAIPTEPLSPTFKSKHYVSEFNVHGSVHQVYSNIYPTRCNVTQFIYIWKLLYMFRVVPPIIMSANNCIYSIWYHPKHVEQFPDKMNCVRHPQHTQTGSTSSTIAADSSNGVTNTRCCRYSCLLS